MQRPFPAYQGDSPFIFVSYAHRDAALVYPILRQLRSNGLKLWYDEGIEPGSRWRDDLAHAIERSERVLFFVSHNSIASANCQKEISFALDKDKRVAVVYLQEANLEAGLALSLSDEQALHLAHYDELTFVTKLNQLLQTTESLQPSTSKNANASIPNHRNKVLFYAIAALVLLACVAIWLMTTNNVAKAQGPPVVAVAAIRNLTGDPDNDWLGDGLAHLVRDKLSVSKHLVVVSDVRWSGLSLASPDTDLATAAKAAGIDYLVSAEIIGSPQGLVLSARMTQLRTGIDLAASSARELSPMALVNQADQLALTVKQALKIPSEEQVQSFAADFQVTNLAAYEAYIAGLQYYNAFDYDAAEHAMRTALQLEPDYAMAAYRLANIQASSGRVEAAKTTLGKISITTAQTDREGAYIAGLKALLAEDNDGAITIYQNLLKALPYEIEAQQFQAEALYRSYQDDKAISVLQQLARQEPENLHVWASLGFMQLSVDRVDEARDALQRYQTLAPTLPNPWELLGNLELKASNFDAAETHYTKALSLDPQFSRAQQGQARMQILRGNFAPAEAALSAIVDNADKTPRDRVEAALDLAALYQAKGAYALVAAPLRALDAQMEQWITLSRSEEGLAALRMGQFDKAETLFNQALSYDFEGYTTTRFLFCLGLVHVANEDAESLRVVIEKLANLPDDGVGGKLEEKAVAYLLGLDALQQRDYTNAVQNLQLAVAQQGYEYRLYRVALAEALLRQGDLQAALQEADKAFDTPISSMAGEPRLDLEVDRRFAQALAIEILRVMGRQAEVEQRQRGFIERWGAVPTLPSVLPQAAQP